MSSCPSCGGIIGRDCFNPEECAWIGQQQEMAAQQKAEEAHHSIQQLNGAIVLRCSACPLPQPTMENCFECFASKLQSTTAPPTQGDDRGGADTANNKLKAEICAFVKAMDNCQSEIVQEETIDLFLKKWRGLSAV